MSAETYIAYLLAVLVFFAHPPGPSQLLFIAHAMRYDVRRALPTMAGDLSANSLQIMIAGFGLVGLIHLSAELFLAIKWLGILYLVWIGARIFRQASASRPAKSAPARGHLFRQGFMTSAANPYAVMFFGALFPQFIDPARELAPQIGILGATYLAIDGLILLLMGATAERLVAMLGGKFRLWTGRISGLFMIFAAMLLALRDTGDAELSR